MEQHEIPNVRCGDPQKIRYRFIQVILAMSAVPTTIGVEQISQLPRANQKFVMEMLNTVIQQTS